MNREPRSPSFFVIGVVMVFVSGCWTVAAVAFPVEIGRPAMVASVAISNVTFIPSILASVFHYAAAGQKEETKKVILAFFSIGTAAPVLSILIFSIANLITPPPWGSIYD